VSHVFTELFIEGIPLTRKPTANVGTRTRTLHGIKILWQIFDAFLMPFAKTSCPFPYHLGRAFLTMQHSIQAVILGVGGKSQELQQLLEKYPGIDIR
jgi:hypothetical protein